MRKHHMNVSGPIINGEPNIIHDDEFEGDEDDTSAQEYEAMQDSEPDPEDR